MMKNKKTRYSRVNLASALVVKRRARIEILKDEFRGTKSP